MVKRDETLQDPLASYMAFAVHGIDSPVARGMASTIPTSVAGAVSLALENLAGAGTVIDEGARERVGKLLLETTRHAGALTAAARDALDAFLHGAGSIEVSHQPKFLGGEKFFFNKMALGHALHRNAARKPGGTLVPFFYLADHDKVHPELVKVHFSSCNSATGFHASIDPATEREFDGAAVHALPVPSSDHLDTVLATIKTNYEFSIASSVQDPFQKALFEERLGEALRLVKLAHGLADDYGSWFLALAGMLSNTFSDHAYLFLRGSDPAFRREILPHYETILSEREKYVALYTGLREEFIQQGLEPPLRLITGDFVPFFIECQARGCHSRRVTLRAENVGSQVVLQGRCEGCGQDVDIVTSQARPDLSDHAEALCPRVESRQYVVSKALAPAIHVAGTGEARYYTMSIPLLRRFDPATFLPVIHYYNKLTTNTFITRALEARIVAAGAPGFLDALKGVMRVAGKFNALPKRATSKPGETEQLRARCIEILKTMKARVVELKRACDGAGETGIPPEVDQVVRVYSANLFGTITKERHGQEPVFHWIDQALHLGMGRFLADHDKLYQPWLPPGLETFV